MRDRYRALVDAVFAKGKHFPKDHGEWVQLRLDDSPEGLFLQLDTWSRALGLKRGAGAYDIVTGFEPRRFIEYLGIDFGGFELHITPTRLAAYERLVQP